MQTISGWFYGSETTDKNNAYVDILMNILNKRKNRLFLISNLIQIYSLNSKKKIDDIMNDKDEIKNAMEKIKNDRNIMYYCYFHDNKIYYLFEYTLLPVYRNKKNHVSDIQIDPTIDEYFTGTIDIDIIKDIIVDTKKYINFDPKIIKIKNDHILKQLIITNNDDILDCIMEKYKIKLTDDDNGCGISYQDLINTAIDVNNAVIVNILNKYYYENKYCQLSTSTTNNFSKEKYYNYAIIINSVLNALFVPIVMGYLFM
jgi:hypothetical protein